MDRREVLKSLVASAIAASVAPIAINAAEQEPRSTALFYVPGYQPDQGRLGGVPLDRHPRLTANLPKGYAGALTLMTRIDEATGAVTRSVMPLKGHHVALHPAKPVAFFSALDGPQMLRFDPLSLALLDIVQPHAQGFMGGGHAAWTTDARVLVNTERRPYARYTGSPADHRGRVVIRDGDTMQVLEVYESYGIGPHDLTLLESDGLMAIANYGTTWQSDPALDKRQPFKGVEPRLSLVDLKTGKLVDRYTPGDERFEVRHVAARDAGHIFTAVTDLQTEEFLAWQFAGDGVVMARDETVSTGLAFGPAPLVAIRREDGGDEQVVVEPEHPLDFRHGQTIVYDPVHDEAIVTFAASHRIAVIDAKSFELKRTVATDAFGLRYPRGLALHPDGKRYAVSGSWRGLYLFARGTHERELETAWHLDFFHHSHMTASAAGSG